MRGPACLPSLVELRIRWQRKFEEGLAVAGLDLDRGKNRGASIAGDLVGAGIQSAHCESAVGTCQCAARHSRIVDRDQLDARASNSEIALIDNDP